MTELRERIVDVVDEIERAVSLGTMYEVSRLEWADRILALLDEPEPVETTDERQARIMLGALTAFAQKWELAEAALDWIEEGEDG